MTREYVAEQGKGKSGTRGKTQEDAQHDIAHNVGRKRSARNLSWIDQRGLRRVDTARHTNLIVTLKQRVIKRAVGIEFAFEDVVLD